MIVFALGILAAIGIIAALHLYPGFLCGGNAGDAVECTRKGTVTHTAAKASAERLFEQASRIRETACKAK